MIAIPGLLMIGGISLGLYLRHRSIRIKKENLAQYMESGETYLRYDNYQKASEEYGEALRLAKNLKREEDTQEADQYKKLAEQIILADEAMTSGEYQKAQGLYLTAREMSVEAGNVGKSYIDSQLKQTKDYISINFDHRLAELITVSFAVLLMTPFCVPIMGLILLVRSCISRQV